MVCLVGKTSSSMPKDPTVNESFAKSEHKDLHGYIRTTITQPMAKYFKQVFVAQSYLSEENNETTIRLLRLQKENAKSKHQIA